MIRVLITDDKPTIRARLSAKLKTEIAGIEIDEADSLRPAIALAESARSERRPYRIAVLDMLLPLELGGVDRVYPEVRRELLLALGRNTCVYNITAHRYFDEVVKFLIGDNLKDRELPSPIVIDEMEKDWEDRLTAQIRSVVHSDRVAEQFERVFGKISMSQTAVVKAGVSQLAPSLRGDMLATADLTQDLNLLIRDIEQHWDDLDGDLKTSIESVFRVERLESGKIALHI
jgi:hypothetical protein